MSKGLLHHVELYVSNLEKSVSFWGWFLEELGYEQHQVWGEGQSWKLEDTYIVFVQTEDKHLYPPYHRCRIGLNHLAFHALSRKHVDDVTDQLRKRHVTILYKDKHPYAGGENYYAVYFEDPDRIKVELVSPF
ncbi:VOC family protein [Salipaludibacillus daqingensis]|uniref:VOC family protein n=1 Tax=Salipaludibacillus daqingensis TaxID=3041001 RepID=UPI002475D5F1|nr:VOC family protein [Salipaludibacillus daqingensis]